MLYNSSLICFIFYYFTTHFFDLINKKLNKYKKIFQYKVIYETNDNNDDNNFDLLNIGLIFIPLFFQNIILIFIGYTTIKNLNEIITNEKMTTDKVYVKTPKSILGIFIVFETIINTFNLPINSYNLPLQHITYSIINITSLYLIKNNFQSVISNSFTNS
jgi:hypothetical protein